MQRTEVTEERFIIIRLRLTWAVACVLAAFAGNLVADQRPAILDPEKPADRRFLSDFSYAGHKNSTSEIPVATGEIINIADHGVRPDAEELS